MMARFSEASAVVDRARKIEPLSVGYFNQQFISLYVTHKYEEALAVLTEAQQFYPSSLRFFDFLGRIYLMLGRYAAAANSITKGLQASSIRPPSMVANLAVAYANTNERTKATELLDELIGRSEANEKGVNIYLVYAYCGLGDFKQAKHWLAKAWTTNDVDLIWLAVDPLLKNLPPENEPLAAPDFDAAEKSILLLLETTMPKLPYHNLGHVTDVFQAAQEIAKSEQVSEEEIKNVRIAALLHDIGFIHSPKNHEEKGAEMARDLLPKFGFDDVAVEVVVNMILATKLPQSPATLMERILCDADLDYLGRSDFHEISGHLYEEMKATGAVENEREWNLVQRTFLQSHRYHTRFGKSNREEVKNQHLQEIITKLKSAS